MSDLRVQHYSPSLTLFLQELSNKGWNCPIPDSYDLFEDYLGETRTIYFIFFTDDNAIAHLQYGNMYYYQVCQEMNCLACGGAGPSLFITTVKFKAINQIDFTSEGNFITVPKKTKLSTITERNSPVTTTRDDPTMILMQQTNEAQLKCASCGKNNIDDDIVCAFCHEVYCEKCINCVCPKCASCSLCEGRLDKNNKPIKYKRVCGTCKRNGKS